MSVVLFSGGCDSTLVLYKLAMQKMQHNDYKSLIALSIDFSGINANTVQKQAREKIKKEFEHRELNKQISYVEMEIKENSDTRHINIAGLMQPGIWLSYSTMYLSSGDTLYCGYHKGDDYWMYKHEAETAFHNYCKLQDKIVNIEYLLMDYVKADVIKELQLRGLYDLCWYCEGIGRGVITDKPCGTCYPCKCHKLALYDLEQIKYTAPTVGIAEIPKLCDTIKESPKVECIKGS